MATIIGGAAISSCSTLEVLPDEILSHILSFVPFSKKNWLSISLTSPRLRDVATKSVTGIAKQQTPLLFSLFHQPYIDAETVGYMVEVHSALSHFAEYATVAVGPSSGHWGRYQSILLGAAIITRILYANRLLRTTKGNHAAEAFLDRAIASCLGESAMLLIRYTTLCSFHCFMRARASAQETCNESKRAVAERFDQDMFLRFEASLLMTGLGFGEQVFEYVHEWSSRMISGGTAPVRAFAVGRQRHSWRQSALEEEVQTWWRDVRSSPEGRIAIEAASQRNMQAKPADANEAICTLFHGSGQPPAALRIADLQELGRKLSFESDKALGLGRC
ncbi:hypothetical protein G647_02339 [Cladophialophora carrionii CBS 160.54]|uniref:F-box domain-containing protein n=1 Tax=Cladophialophora carrionii CBS 160.54 TaxID=1279043 RepID=V9DFC7_9EURO|nr:uncharacterized protein G647_02339 [Cladophialophora carrionii CBS 160.54]ETI25565.1 hypothetical protein G647_02339 [Cladophialophora carrionii CBS 160.54]